MADEVLLVRPRGRAPVSDESSAGMREILLAGVFFSLSVLAADAAWEDAPGCAQRVAEARDATRSFYRYYGEANAQAAEALARLEAIRSSLGPAREACTGDQERRVIALQERDLRLIERDIRASAPWVTGQRLEPVVTR